MRYRIERIEQIRDFLTERARSSFNQNNGEEGDKFWRDAQNWEIRRKIAFKRGGFWDDGAVLRD